MSNVRSSVYWLALTRYASLTLQFATTVIISRLLTPSEIGLFSIAMSFILIAHVMREFGIVNYIVQADEITTELLRQAKGAAYLVGWSLALLVYITRSLVAKFYNSPELSQILGLLSISLLLVPMGLITRATLVRDIRFDRICIVDLSISAVQNGVNLSLAFAGFGPIGLAWGNIAAQAIGIVMLTAERPYIARLLPSFRGIGAILRFGGYSGVGGLVNQLGAQLPNLLLGWFIGFAAVGQFSRADSLINLYRRGIESVIMPVALPAFASVRHDSYQIKCQFLNSLGLLSAVTWSFFGCLALLAEPLVLSLFGEAWRPAVPVLQILCLANLPLAYTTLGADLLRAFGAVRLYFYRATQLQALNFAITALGALYSLEAVAIGQVISSIINVIMTYFYLRRLINLSIRDLVSTFFPSIFVSLAAVLSVYLTAHGAGIVSGAEDMLLRLASVGGIALIAWIGAVFAVGHPLGEELQRLACWCGKSIRSVSFRLRAVRFWGRGVRGGRNGA